ncbi:MAG TPA: cytochrome c [Bryobacteraceae bacterium]|nr:cytochrome c [Bryobacteraceae bacterium]
MTRDRISFRITAPVALLCSSLLAVPPWGRAEEQKRRNDEPMDVVLARVPEKARGKANPYQNDAEAVLGGKKLFEQHCAECHGATGGGGNRGPSLLPDEKIHATPGETFWILTNGVVRRGMPSWSKLPEQQRWQIVAFLSSLK